MDVPPPPEPSGFWIRAGALVIDGFLLGVLRIIFAWSFHGQLPKAAMTLASALISLAYAGATVGAWGQTVGKMAAGIRVIQADGGPVGYPRAFGRALASFFSTFTMGVGYLMATFTPQKRALHDYLAGTRVVDEPGVGAGRRALVRALAVLAVLLPLAAGFMFVFSPAGRGLAGISGGRFAELARKSKEGANKGKLGSLRAGAAIYYGEHDGVYPQALAAVPLLELSDHPASSEVAVYGGEVCAADGRSLNPDKLRDTGHWGYVADKASPCWGTVFVDCAHRDDKGAAFNSW